MLTIWLIPLCLSTCYQVADSPLPNLSQPSPRHATNQRVEDSLDIDFSFAKRPRNGIAWTEGMPLPKFAKPKSMINTIQVQDLSIDEQLFFAVLQGHINRRRPRLMLLDARADQGRDTWLNTGTVEITSQRRFRRPEKYDLLHLFLDEVDGVVLYDPAKSPHYRNLAGTIAGLTNCLPVTRTLLDELGNNGIDLEIKEDLSELPWTTPIGIYQHLYTAVWPKCEKRLLVSASPHGRGGDHHHTRDMAAACGAAVVWLDTMVEEERELLSNFLREMPAGNSVVLGWYASERSGITMASRFGIGTLPADHYSSSTVFAGMNPEIMIPPVPQLPLLQNRVYVALLISDGDNIQYMQRAMRKFWDSSVQHRGRIPLNWTISPAICDIGPAILNYYYTTATEHDCFVSGPSGMGYLMPVNTLEEPGANVGIQLHDLSRMDGYAGLTERYLIKSGLRVVTIWDDATAEHRASYERFCRSLYGATVQNFRDVPAVASSWEGQRLLFQKLEIPYASSTRHLRRSLTQVLREWDGQSPMFVAYQVNIWGELKPQQLVSLAEELGRLFPDRVEFVRADHYFNLKNQANRVPWNLMLSPETRITGPPSASSAQDAIDGTPVSVWESSNADDHWLTVDFGQVFQISRYRLLHAAVAHLPPKLNTRSFQLFGSLDGANWTQLSHVVNNQSAITDRQFSPATARYLRLQIDNPGADGTARLADWEVYGVAQ